MKMVDCQELLGDCDLIFTGADDDEVARYARAHAIRSHDVAADDPAFHEQLRSAIVPLD
jgi:predicted small metal-binding protein